MASDYLYFDNDHFFDNELIELNQVVQESWRQVTEFLLLDFKALLDKQTQQEHVLAGATGT